MMNTPLFLFGMKLYKQLGYMEFFDADFCTSLFIKCPLFDDKPLGEVCEIINEGLLKTGFEDQLLEIGVLKDIQDFDLSKIIVKKDFQVTVRFNSFDQALKAYQSLSTFSFEKAPFSLMFLNPSPNYYDGKLSTQFESCIKDKFEGLRFINEIDSTYIKRQLNEILEGNKMT